jgi:DNA mismatch endonuclease (patch repair protein)
MMARPAVTRTDTLTPAQRSERMSRIKGRDTKPEMIVRHLTHGLGYRYRLHVGQLPGRPDLVFRSRRRVSLVHGCFWHRHPDPACKVARLPKSRLDFWRPKLEANAKSDATNEAKLAALGWRLLTVWECETVDRNALRSRITSFLGEDV